MQHESGVGLTCNKSVSHLWCGLGTTGTWTITVWSASLGTPNDSVRAHPDGTPKPIRVSANTSDLLCVQGDLISIWRVTVKTTI